MNLPLTLAREELKNLLGESDEKIWRSAFYKVSPLLHPRGGYEIFSLEKIEKIGKRTWSHLAGCDDLAVMAVTLGPEIDREIATAFERGETKNAFLLDAIASAAVEGAIDALCVSIQQRHGPLAFRFSPGYGDWSVEDNAVFREVLDLPSLGITLLPSGGMLPRKSVTALAGLSKSGESVFPGCQHCSVGECRFPCRFRSKKNE
ncbi:MAG TPA: hypothetical protein V6C82_02510 [Chroococcales cyanobacterium]